MSDSVSGAPAPVLLSTTAPRPTVRRRRRVIAALGTLRWKLTLTYVLLVAALLAALGTYQYLSLRRNLIQGRVDTLLSNAAEVRGVFVAKVYSHDRGGTDPSVPAPATLPVATKVGPSPGPSPTPTPRPSRPANPFRVNAQVAQQIATALCQHLGGGGSMALQWPSATAATLANAVEEASGRQVAVVVYDHSLSAKASGPDTLDMVPSLDPQQLQQAQSGLVSTAQTIGGGQNAELGIAVPVGRAAGDALGKTAAQPCGVVQLSSSTAQTDSVLSGERALLTLGGGGVLLLALLAGLLLTSRALRPLKRLSQAAGELAGGNLRARSQLTPRNDEIGALATSFDHMAERVEEAFTARTESEAQVRRFIADASHELRTPVTALKGYIDVIRRGAVHDPGAMDAALEAMARESERMRRLVLDLLTLARIDASHSGASGAINVNEIVVGLLDEGMPGMPDTIEQQLAEPPVIALCDQNALVTILRNLMVNACKYAPGARQTWRTERQDRWAVVTVADAGPGIPSSDLPHVFERFYRGEKTRAREEGGSGLGLSIAQGLARAQGGEVRISSHEGRGTTVSVLLPSA